MWFPDWSLGRPDAPPGRELLVTTGSKVVAATSGAIDAGVRPGMGRGEAEGLCPGAVVLMRDLGEETRRFEAVVTALEELIPKVEVVEPGLMLVPVAGAVRYYGGEEPLAETVVGKLSTFGWELTLAIADGPFAAMWAAKGAEPARPRIISDTRSFLAELDVSTLAGPDVLDVDSLVATFRWLGVTTLGALAALPRQAIASRFGDLGLSAHRLAHGEDRAVEPRPIPPVLAVEERFEEPLELMDQFAFASRSLAYRLMESLRQEGVAPHRVTIEAETEEGAVRARVWRSADPFTEQALADRAWWQLRAWVDLGGIVRLRLDPSDLSGTGRQLSLLDDVGARVEADRALARAQALVGPDAVLQAIPQGGRLPHQQVIWYRWGEAPPPPERDPGAPWPGANPPPTPALVPDEPPLLEVEWDEGIPVRVRLGSRWEPVLAWAGPWRMTGRWWRGEKTVDRYQLVTSAGALLCTVSDGRTRLMGVYD